MSQAKQIADGLSKAQKNALLSIERDGNGAHVYHVQSLAKLGLMKLTKVERLLGARAYRISPLGIAVRSALLSERSKGEGNA